MKTWLSLFVLLISGNLRATTLQLELEGGPAWQTRNDFQIPPNSGTRVALAQVDKGPAFAWRTYVSWHINDNHRLRALIAPLTIAASYPLSGPLIFRDTSFASGSQVTAKYKFNSYRLSYQYWFPTENPVRFRIGFTAKIRDAKIEIADSSQVVAYTDVGFVPLLHAGLTYQFLETWYLDLDIDALAAPQGRAEDIALRLGYRMAPWDFSLGYRTVEGGASNDKVFTFAWFHYLLFRAGVSF